LEEMQVINKHSTTWLYTFWLTSIIIYSPEPLGDLFNQFETC
jgi:hypothetical protein